VLKLRFCCISPLSTFDTSFFSLSSYTFIDSRSSLGIVVIRRLVYTLFIYPYIIYFVPITYIHCLCVNFLETSRVSASHINLTYLLKKLGKCFVIRYDHRAVIIFETPMNDGTSSVLLQTAHPRLVISILPILIFLDALAFM